MRIYLSGPISNYTGPGHRKAKDCCPVPPGRQEEFERAAETIRAAGHDCVNPFDFETERMAHEYTYAQILGDDLRELSRCDAIAVLPGWERSRGATLEVRVADALDIPVLHADTLLPVGRGDNYEITRGGIKHDHGKDRWDLFPWDAARAVVKILTAGASKYEDRNWERGMRWGRVYAAAMRHLTTWWQDRSERDKDSGQHPLAHAVCCLMFLLAYVCRQPDYNEYDDRPRTERYTPAVTEEADADLQEP